MGFVIVIILVSIVAGLIQVYVDNSTSIKENSKHLASKK